MDPKTITKEQIEEEKKKAVEDATTALQDELKKFKDKEFNFSKARAGKEDILAENEAKEKKIKELEEGIANLKGTVETVSSRYKNSLIKAVAGSDEELKKKVEENYLRLKGTQNNLTDEQERVLIEDAYTLSTKTEEGRGIIRRLESSSGGNNRIAPARPTDQIDPEVKKWAQEFSTRVPKMAISDEDLKNPKYKVKPGQDKETNSK